MWADGGELYTSGKLSSSLINCITQDKYGFIWVGTEYGLSRFDGYRFTNYLHNEKDSTSITDNIISSFLVDKKGNLWIGCAKGLMRYNYETNDFTRLKFPDGRKPRIYSLVESHNGDILMGTAGFGLYSLRKDSKRIVHERQYAERETDVFFTHIYFNTFYKIIRLEFVSHLSHFCLKFVSHLSHDFFNKIIFVFQKYTCVRWDSDENTFPGLHPGDCPLALHHRRGRTAFSLSDHAERRHQIGGAGAQYHHF